MEIRKYWEIFYRWRKLFYQIVIWTFVIAILIPVIYQYLLFGRIYKITAQIRINKSEVLVNLLTDVPNQLGSFTSDKWFNDIVTLVENDRVYFRVANRLNLKTSSGKPYAPGDFVNGGMLKAITKRKGVYIEDLTDTEVINIGGISTKPEEAAAIANTYVEELRKEMIEANQYIGQKAVQFFQQEIPKLKDQLAVAEESALQYRVENHLSDIDTYRSQLISQQANYESSISVAERAIKENNRKKQAILNQMAKQPEYKLTSDTYAKNPQIDTLKQSLLSTERDLASNLLLYTEEHPSIKTLRKQIDVLQKQLREQIEKSFSQEVQARSTYFDTLIGNLGDLEIDDTVEAARTSILKQQLNDLVDRLDQLTQKENEYLRLSRLVTVLRTRMSNYLSELETAKAVTLLDVGNITVLSPATVPTDNSLLKGYTYFPKKKIIVLLALLISVIGGITTVYIVDYADDRINHPEKLRKAVPANCGIAGTVEANPSHPSVFSSLDVLSPAVRRQIQEIASYWKLRTANQPNSILSIVSPGSQEGKSFLAIALALVCAQAGEKVLLVDANILTPAISSLLNISIPESGMPATIEQTRSQIVSTATPNLSIFRLPSGGQAADISKLSGLFDSLKKEYPVILIDTPGLSLSRMGAHISTNADQIYLVTRWNQTRAQQIQEAVTDLKEAGISPTGTILNGVKQI